MDSDTLIQKFVDATINMKTFMRDEWIELMEQINEHFAFHEDGDKKYSFIATNNVNICIYRFIDELCEGYSYHVLFVCENKCAIILCENELGYDYDYHMEVYEHHDDIDFSKENCRDFIDEFDDCAIFDECVKLFNLVDQYNSVPWLGHWRETPSDILKSFFTGNRVKNARLM